MNGTIESLKSICTTLNGAELTSQTGKLQRFIRFFSLKPIYKFALIPEIVISPPSLYLVPLKDHIRPEVAIAAQNAYVALSGAYTGEISPSQLVDAGIPWVILGHSERRQLFHETNEVVAKKTAVALDAGLSVILCIGETLAEREAGTTIDVVEKQLNAVAKEIKDWR